MASGTGTPAGRPGSGRNWQDWTILVLAAWLFVSPWALGFGGTVRTPTDVTIDGGIPAIAAADAAWNAWVAGGILFMIAISANGRRQYWQECANFVIGLWIFVAPWVVGFAGLNAAALNHWVVGALISLSALSLWRAGGGLQQSASRPPSRDS